MIHFTNQNTYFKLLISMENIQKLMKSNFLQYIAISAFSKHFRSENGELFADEYDEIFENFEEKSSVFACTFLQDC